MAYPMILLSIDVAAEPCRRSAKSYIYYIVKRSQYRLSTYTNFASIYYMRLNVSPPTYVSETCLTLTQLFDNELLVSAAREDGAICARFGMFELRRSASALERRKMQGEYDALPAMLLRLTMSASQKKGRDRPKRPFNLAVKIRPPIATSPGVDRSSSNRALPARRLRRRGSESPMPQRQKLFD
jgi:hypothetical protein